MDCKLEPDMRPKCGGGWRNSVFSIEQFTPEEKKINEAKEINDSFKSIIADIDQAREDAKEAYRLAKKISWITGRDMRLVEAKKQTEQIKQ